MCLMKSCDIAVMIRKGGVKLFGAATAGGRVGFKKNDGVLLFVCLFVYSAFSRKYYVKPKQEPKTRHKASFKVNVKNDLLQFTGSTTDLLNYVFMTHHVDTISQLYFFYDQDFYSFRIRPHK